MKPLVAIALAASMAACAPSITTPLVGTINNPVETFNGTTTNFAGDPTGGTFTLQTAAGVVCNGTYRYATATGGRAPLTCSDGRTGMLEFTSNGFSGSASGVIVDRAFAVKF